MRLFVFLMLVVLCGVGQAEASIIHRDPSDSTILQSIHGLDVEGVLLDVTFIDGSFNDVYGTGIPPANFSPFFLGDFSGAKAAAFAIEDLLNTVTPTPDPIVAVLLPVKRAITIPFQTFLNSPDFYGYAGLVNTGDSWFAPPKQGSFGAGFSAPRDSGAVNGVFAKFTHAVPHTHNPIPEPTSVIIWALLGTVGMATGWRRRRRVA